MTILATILSGNSEALVADAIRSVRDWVDGILLIDTGITDGTVGVAREAAGAKLQVARFSWCHDFAAARNFALAKAAESGATWALTVDTDERLGFPGFTSPERLRAALAADPEVLAWLVSCRDGSYAKERFVRVPTALEWRGRTHEALCGAGPHQRRILAGVEFFEVRKTPEQYQAKLRRDLEVLRAETRENPDNPRWWYYLGQTLEELGARGEQGFVLAKQGDSDSEPGELFRAAADAYRRCYELRGGWAEQAAWACFRAASCLERLQDFQQTLEVCTLGLARQPQSPELAWMAGFCCFRLGRWRDAVTWEEIALGLGHVEGSCAGRHRISFRHLPGWYEGPYDVLRFAWARLGEPAKAEECARQVEAARQLRLGSTTASAGPAGSPAGIPQAAGAGFHVGGDRPPRATRVAMLGLYSSGSSALAGVLHHLGVCLGRQYSGLHFEAFGLAAQLRRWWCEPELREAEPPAGRVRELASWVRGLESDGAGFVGAKHPLLCLCGPDLQQAWGPDTKFLWAYRPLEQSVASLVRRGWWPGREREIQSRLWDFALLQQQVSMNVLYVLEKTPALKPQWLEAMRLVADRAQGYLVRCLQYRVPSAADVSLDWRTWPLQSSWGYQVPARPDSLKAEDQAIRQPAEAALTLLLCPQRSLTPEQTALLRHMIAQVDSTKVVYYGHYYTQAAFWKAVTLGHIKLPQP